MRRESFLCSTNKILLGLGSALLVMLFGPFCSSSPVDDPIQICDTTASRLAGPPTGQALEPSSTSLVLSLWNSGPRAPATEMTRWHLFLPAIQRAGIVWDHPDLVILDTEGNVRDWAWLYDTFGSVEILTATDSPAYRVCVLQAQEWDSTLQVFVLQNGVPVQGIPVVRYWPDAPVLPPELVRWPGFDLGVYGMTKENGEVGFGMGSEDWYHLPDGAVSAEWVAEPGVASDLVDGLGMVFGSNRLHLDVTFCLGE